MHISPPLCTPHIACVQCCVLHRGDCPQARAHACHDSEMITLRARVQALGDVVRASASASPAGQSVSPKKGGRAKLSLMESTPSKAAAAHVSVSPVPSTSNHQTLQAAAQMLSTSFSSSASASASAAVASASAPSSSSIKHLLPSVSRDNCQTSVAGVEAGETKISSNYETKIGSNSSVAAGGRAAAVAAAALAQQSKITGERGCF
jgi:hypothetical protein